VNCGDIKAAIKAEEQRLTDKFRADLEGISITIGAKDVRVWAYGTRGSDRFMYKHAEGSTPEEAAERLRLDHFPSPEQKIARLRDQARELLRSAADLEKEGAR
jgi:hypothetical protein